MEFEDIEKDLKLLKECKETIERLNREIFELRMKLDIAKQEIALGKAALERLQSMNLQEMEEQAKLEVKNTLRKYNEKTIL